MQKKPAQSETLLKKAGLKKTDARVALLDLLASASKPLSAKALSAKLAKKAVDRVTVYRMLEALSEKGIVRHVEIGSREAHYELTDTRADHHHVICLECKKIADFTGCDADHLIAKALKQVKDFKSVSHHSFDLFGVCTSCAGK